MSIITVPVINDSPNTLNVSFQTEYAVSFEAANPDGVPGNCQPGGAGVVGGPEYVNLLQRANPSTAQAQGFSYENFQLSAHPGYEFFSIKNFVTGKKTVVAFKTAIPGTVTQYANSPVGLIALGATGGASGATGVAATFYPTPAGASGVTGLGGGTLVWNVTGAVAAVSAGQGSTGAKFTVGVLTGTQYVTATLTKTDGTVVTSSAAFIVH